MPYSWGMSSIREALIRDIERFCREQQVSQRQFGLDVAADHKLLARLRSGAGVTLTLIERIERKLATSGAVTADDFVDQHTSPSAREAA